MENKLKIFEHSEFKQIRVVEIEGQPWFVGKDVAANLGYGRADNAIRLHVDSEDKLMHQISASGQSRRMAIINESGLYSLILSSKLPQAKAFKRWVTTEVLPSIRKHGAYATEDTLEKMLHNPKFTEALLETIAEEHAKNLVLEDTVNKLKPKAHYFDRVIQGGESIQTSIIAKDYGMTAVKFNRLLHELCIQYKVGNTWLLYNEYTQRGYTKTKTFNTPSGDNIIHTYWTQKGRQFLYEILAFYEIFPLHEDDGCIELPLEV